MNPYAIPSIVSCIGTLILGAYVLYRNPKGLTNRLFAALTLTLAIWVFAEFGYRTAPDLETAFLWDRIGGFGFCFIPPVFLHFMLAFTKQRKILDSFFSYLLIYLPAAVILYLLWTTDLIASGMIKVYWGYTYLPGKAYLFYMGYFILCFLLSFGLCVWFWKTTNIFREKKQAQFIFMGSLLTLIIALTTDLILPPANIRIPEMGTTSLLILVVSVTYAMRRYEFLVVTPSIATAIAIIEAMGDGLVVTDLDGTIISTNCVLEERLGRRWGIDAKEIIGKSALDLPLIKPEEIERFMGLMRETIERGYAGPLEVVRRTLDGREVWDSFTTSLLKDAAGNPSALFAVVRDITELKCLQEKEKAAAADKARAEEAEKFTKELQKKVNELEEFSKIAVERELEMKKLEEELEKLRGKK